MVLLPGRGGKGRRPDKIRYKGDTAMKNVVSEVNGYKIHLEITKQEGEIFAYYTYWTEIGPGKTKKWKTLRGAIKWCEKH